MFSDLVDIAKIAFAKPNGTSKYQIMRSPPTFAHSFVFFKRVDVQSERILLQKEPYAQVWHPHNTNVFTNRTEEWYAYCAFLEQILSGFRYTLSTIVNFMNSDVGDRLYVACFSYLKRFDPPIDS